MSRVGKQPIPLPANVQVDIQGSRVTVTGPLGTLSRTFHPDIRIKRDDEILTVSRHTDQRQHRALHGLTRSLLSNMTTGVSQGFQKTLDLVGVGYRVQQTGESITLSVGYSHTVEVSPLTGVKLVVEGNNRIQVQGVDKEAVGEMAARIRRIRRPNAYTGKGIRYANEQVHLKPGKGAGRKT